MKIGDKVLYDYSGRRMGAGMAIETITRETPKQWVTVDNRGNESKWHKDNLQLVGTKSDAWSGHPTIEPLTDEAKARYNVFAEKIKSQRIMNEIRKLPTTPNLSSARLQEILDELKTK